MCNLKRKVCRNGEFGLRRFLMKPKWTILTKEFGGTYLCDRLSHRWLGTEEKGSCGWLPGVVVRGPRFVPPVLELRSDERGEEMICAGTDLR